jgi:diaminohydroxyphosphoribosylaminopyrimidine deaminase/5-amino-6-(5-phosphoribosylamino)uracil reductase
MDEDVFACLRGSDRLVIGQIGQSSDGRVAGPNGERQFVNGMAGLAHLHRLRALVDAVVIGVQTALIDDPQLTVRRVAGRSPARVVIDPRGRVPSAAKLFADNGARRLIVSTQDRAAAPGIEVIAIEADGEIPPRAIVDALARRGLKRLLIEGGTRTLASFLTAGCLDRLHVVVAPVALGEGPPSLVESVEAFRLDGHSPPITRHRLDEEMLYDFDLSDRGRASRST